MVQPEASRPVALIADNEEGIASLLAEVLRHHGFATETVGDGQAAIDRLAQPGVALLVCDLMMPRVDGKQVLRHLAAMETAPPALVVSGHLDEGTAEWLRGCCGVVAVFRKPFDLFEFARCARAAVPEAGRGSAARG